MNINKIIVSTVITLTLAAATGSVFAGTVTNAVDRSGCRLNSKLCYGNHKVEMEQKKQSQMVSNPQITVHTANLRSQNFATNGGGEVSAAERSLSVMPRLGDHL